MKEVKNVFFLSKKLNFKPLRTRVMEHEGKYLVFYSSIYYNLRNQPSRKEIHCFYYDDIDGDFYSFIPLIKILSDKDLKEKVVLDDQDDDPDFEPFSSESESESEEDEEMDLIDSVDLTSEKRIPYKKEELILEDVENIKITEEDEILAIERGLNDPTRINLQKEAEEILLLEKNGYNVTGMEGYKVGYYHYQMQKIVVREVHYRNSFSFFTIKSYGCNQTKAYDEIWKKDENEFMSLGYQRYLDSIRDKWDITDIEKIKNIESDVSPLSVTLL